MNSFTQRDKAFVWHPFTPQHDTMPANIFIERAEGVYLHTKDGRRIIDGISSWWVNIHGHSHPQIAQALFKQASTMEHVIFAGFTHEPAIQLAENLISVLPSNIKKIFYSDNGSTANEVAIKMAIQYWHNRNIKKKTIIAIEGAYHGDTFGAMAVGDRSLFTAPFTDYLFDVQFIPFPTTANEREVIESFKALVSQNQVGAFIFEPLIQGAAGMRMYSPKVLNELLSIAKRHEVICIADEVFSGFFRTGKFLATEYVEIKPDIIALSKGLTGGTMPLGVTACSQEIYDAYQSTEMTKAFLHGHSYTANPLACAVGNTSFRLLFQEDCQQRISDIAKSHAEFVQELGSDKIREARQLGTILALEIQTQETTGYTNAIRKKIYDYFLNQDILLRPLGNVIYIVPPYVITPEELRKIYEAIKSFLKSI